MNPFTKFIMGVFVSIPVGVLVWLGSFFAGDQTFLLSSAFSVGGGAITYTVMSVYLQSRFLKKQGLTNKEYKYIKKNLDEAKQKIARLQKSLFSIRNISNLKQRIDILRMTKKIYSLTNKEPKRFYLAERFYFSHLDSVVELTEKYALLSAQPKKNHEIEQSLSDTRFTLDELTNSLENDLYQALSADIDHLNFEIDVAKHSIKSLKEIHPDDEHKVIK